jgi:hypothetical protein
MNELIIKGIKNIEGMKFHDIEGGFGKGKKAVLVKEISEIHGRDLKDINRNINNNIKRFRNGVDILDLKNGDFDSPLQELGFSKRDISISNNIYLLSERGYSKLLKILEDDVAWEQYEKLVDGYFNMRGNMPKLSKELQAIFTLDARTVELNKRIDNLEDTMTIDHGQAVNIKHAVDIAVKRLCFGSETAAYKSKDLKRKIYQYAWRNFKDYFNITAYHNLLRKDMETALGYIQSLILQGSLLREVQSTNNQMSF